MKILIVDDDPGTLNALMVGLTSFGHQVVGAKDGHQALSIIESSIEETEPVDFMVTDLRIPGMNGLELIRAGKELSSGLAAILMTAYGDDNVQREARNLYRCGYLAKPFSPEKLLKMITGLKV